MLGWKIVEGGEYKVPLEKLSEEELQVVLNVEEKFKQVARTREISSREEALSLIRDSVVWYGEAEGILFDKDQIDYLSETALLHIYGYGFVEKILEDPEVEEVSVIGIGKPAYVYIRGKGWLQTNAAFTDEKALMEVINKMGRGIGRRITLQKPKLNAVLPDGSRLHATLFPLSQGELTVRKFTEHPFSPSELAKLRTFPYRAMAALSLVMQSDMSLIVSGNTASGKTTTLNSLFSFVPLDERVIITEETPEINVPHPQKVRLVANEEMGIPLRELVYDTLRMRPDRLIVGEVRSREEVETLFDALLGGQARGCYATFHAQNTDETLRRFKFYGIDELDFKSIDCVLVQRRVLNYDRKSRKLREMRRMIELSFGRPLTPLFRYEPKGDRWNEKALKPFLSSVSSSLGISEKEGGEELKAREKFIRKEHDFFEFCEAYQRRFYGIG